MILPLVKEPPPALNKSSIVDGYEYDVCGCDGARERSINTDMYVGYIAHTYHTRVDSGNPE